MMLAAILLGAACCSAVSPTTVSRFSCDQVTHTLLWEQSSATLRFDDSGSILTAASVVKPSVPLAAQRRRATVGVALGEVTLSFKGNRVTRCDAGACQTAVKLPVSVLDAQPGQGGDVIMATAGQEPGLYRGDLEHLVEPTLVLAGDVLSLCPTGVGVLALIRRETEVVLVMLKAQGDVLTQTFSAALLSAVRAVPPSLGVLETAILAFDKQSAKDKAALGLLLAVDARAEARSLAPSLLAGDATEASQVMLQKLGRDGSVDVRSAAFVTVAASLKGLAKSVAISRLQGFVTDSDQDIAWSARDALLDWDAKKALADAPVAYKLDLLTMLSARCQRSGCEAVREPLRLLAADNDAGIREAARLIENNDAP